MLCCIKYYELRFQNNSASATLSLSPIVQLDVKDMSLNGWIHNPCWGSHGHQDILHRNHHSLWGSLKTLEISSNFQDSGALGWAKDGERSWKVRDINKPMISQGYPKYFHHLSPIPLVSMLNPTPERKGKTDQQKRTLMWIGSFPPWAERMYSQPSP